MAKPIVRLVAETNDYEKKMRQANKTFHEFMRGIGMNVSKFTALSAGIAGVTTAMKVAKDAFLQSEGRIDEWGRTMEGAKSAYNLFLDTLNNGNWSSFFKNLETAIRGGRDLYDVFDRLGSIKSNNAAAIAITQKEIAELRLAKQQGENVDAKLKSATARLAELQKQSVNAGMTAGRQSAYQTIRSGVNSIGVEGVNDATIQYVVQNIMKNGQSEFDKYSRNLKRLQALGTVQTPKIVANTSGGATVTTESFFDISRLTKEQQKQYAIAKAITDGETRIQKGIAAYAQAVGEGTQSAREAFKGNRYALTGSGGSTGGRSSATRKDTYIPSAGSIDAQTKKVQELQRAWRAAADDDSREKYRKQIEEAEFALDILTGKTSGLPAMNYGIGDLLGSKGGGINGSPSIATNKNEWRLDDKAMRGLSDQIARANTKTTASLTKEVGSIAGGISGIFGGIESLGVELPEGLKNVIGGIEGVVGILSSIAAIVTAIEALAAADTIIPFARGGVVRAAGGTVIPGNFPSGDNIRMPILGGGMAALNSGELILNKAETNAIASQLSCAASIGDYVLVSEIAGEDIRIALRRNSMRRRKGEYITTKRG